MNISQGDHAGWLKHCCAFWGPNALQGSQACACGAAGLLDEKIFQRQLSKQELAVSMEQGAGSSRGQASARFTRDELRQLFSLNLKTACDTADLLSPNDTSWKVPCIAAECLNAVQ